MAAIVAGLALASCQTEGVSPSTKAMAPLTPAMVADIEARNMDKTSPILVRLFKEEAELEVWKEDRTGRFALLKTYPICRWSGDLGPKIKEGDRQAPEGFYTVRPGQMNPNSSYYLSFDLGYPNAFDKALGRTGSNLMVHGDCSSRGCYAMTDEQVTEIYALGRESFFGGQRAFQVQAYPFRMTSLNMARHRNNPHMPFWRMIKQGYDHFEVTRLEPKVDVCEKRYVFNAQAPMSPATQAAMQAGMPMASPALSFNASAKCPVYEVPAEIADAVNAKQRKDEIEIAELTRRNTPHAPSRAGADGGINPVFLAGLGAPEEGRDAKGNVRIIARPNTGNVFQKLPGTLPPIVTLPGGPQSQQPQTAYADTSAAPTQTRMAAAEPQKPGNFFSRLFKPAQTEEPKPVAEAPAPLPRPAPAARTAAPRSPEPARTAAAPPPAPAAAAPVARAPQPKPAEEPRVANAAAPKSGLISGAQPVVSSSSFESRFGTFR